MYPIMRKATSVREPCPQHPAPLDCARGTLHILGFPVSPSPLSPLAPLSLLPLHLRNQLISGERGEGATGSEIFTPHPSICSVLSSPRPFGWNQSGYIVICHSQKFLPIVAYSSVFILSYEDFIAKRAGLVQAGCWGSFSQVGWLFRPFAWWGFQPLTPIPQTPLSKNSWRERAAARKCLGQFIFYPKLILLFAVFLSNQLILFHLYAKDFLL